MGSKTRPGHWLGFDLGGTKMLATVYNDRFEAVGRQRKKTKGYDGPDLGVERIVTTMQQALDEAELTSDDLIGIGLGCPSPIDMEAGIVLDAVNLGWKNLPLQKILAGKFSCPVTLLNDVDAGTYGEYRFGAAMGARTVLGVFPGTGIGGGCIYNGEVLHGAHSSCMEIGHIKVQRAGSLCGCGQRGCLETEASRLAISAEVAKAAYRGKAPYIMETAGTKLSDIRSSVLSSAIEAGDTAVEEIIQSAARLIGLAIANFVHLLCPDVILLGGGLVEAMPELFVSEVHKSVKRNTMPAFAKSFQTVAAELGDDATVLGAAGWIQKTVEAVPAST